MALIKVYKDIFAELLLMHGNSKNSTVFVFQTLRAGNVNIAHETQIYHFVELLGAFISNQLDINREYRLAHAKEPKSGYVAKIVSQNKQHFLLVMVGEKKYYFDKYECRIIAKIINKILSKCTLSELTGYAR